MVEINSPIQYETKSAPENVSNLKKVVQNLSPKRVEQPFFRKRGGVFNTGFLSWLPRITFDKNQPMMQLNENVLFLIKQNFYVDVIEGVRAGTFNIETPHGVKSVELHPNKILSIKYGEQLVRGWIAYEDCMMSYPEEPHNNSEMYKKTASKLAMNWRDRDEGKLMSERTKMWVWIIGISAVAIILLISNDTVQGIINGWMNKPAADAAFEAVKSNINVNTGVP